MSVTTSTFQNFVGGKWVDAADGGTAEIINPSTGETIAEVPNGTQADVDRGVVNIVVGFAPLKPAEFVVIQIQQIAGQLET